ncbi:hypothetical protein [Cytobacillus purgationiresistens]|nr:hypothetical protein [Cytobacillus purgationiresistens]
MGGSSSYENGALTQEGFAVYTQNEHGSSAFPNYGAPIHEIMKYFIDQNKSLPMYKIADSSFSQSTLHSASKTATDDALSWISIIKLVHLPLI